MISSTTTEGASATRGGPSGNCDVCGLGINPALGLVRHHDCDRKAEQKATVETLVSEDAVLGELGDHALAYARAGLSVLPLHPRQKTPASRHGKDDATTDLDRIARWWSRHPDHNIGIRPDEGIVVLDVDPRNGGDEELADLIAKNEPLPTTWAANTGSGGQHIWLRAPGPFRGTLCAGVDLKSHSGYLVVPPSVHPNGKRYSWANHRQIVFAPAWLRPLLAPPTSPPRRPLSSAVGANGLVETVATAAEGNRNAALFWAASRAAAEGVLTDMSAALVAAAVNNGLPEREATATIRSAERGAPSA